MNRKILFSYTAGIIFLIFLMNLVANKLYLYSSLWYFDMIMHFLGGFWLGLFFFWLFYKDIFPDFKTSSVIKLLLSVFLVGLLWELYEIGVNASFAKDAFNLIDTLSDLVCDMLGGFSIYLIIRNVTKNLQDTL
jgi:hypothetical protein